MRSPHKIPRKTHDEFVFGILGELSPTFYSAISKSLKNSVYTNPISDYSKLLRLYKTYIKSR